MNQQKTGDFIKKLRKEMGITQQELANKLNITDRAISKWENGRCMPDISFLIPLSNILKVEISELIKGEKISDEDLEKMNDVIEEVVNTAVLNNNKKQQTLNKWIVAGLFFYIVSGLESGFRFLSFINNSTIQEFINGLLWGMGLLCFIVGYLNNNKFLNRIRALTNEKNK